MIVPCEAVVGVGTTASCVAPGSDALVANGRAPQSGTAAPVTTEFGSAPNSAPCRGEGSRRTRAARVRPASQGRGPDVLGRGRRAHRNGPTRPHRPRARNGYAPHHRLTWGVPHCDSGIWLHSLPARRGQAGEHHRSSSSRYTTTACSTRLARQYSSTTWHWAGSPGPRITVGAGVASPPSTPASTDASVKNRAGGATSSDAP